jgi:hypothetical protein
MSFESELKIELSGGGNLWKQDDYKVDYKILKANSSPYEILEMKNIEQDF